MFFHQHTRILCLLAAGLALSAQAGFANSRTWRIAEETLHHRVVMDAEGFAEVSSPIHNPLQRPQIREVMPDGAWAEKGTVIAAFDDSGPSNDLQRAYLSLATAEATLERDIAQIDNSDLTLRDRYDEVVDSIAVLEARYERLRSMPDPTDVAIAESRLRVANLAWEAASNEYAKAIQRFDDNLISLQERENHEAERDTAAAELLHARRSLEITSRPTEPHEMRTLELEIENTILERDKVAREIAKNEDLVEIRKRGARVRVDQINRQVSEREEAVKATQVIAPNSGHVMHLSSFRRNILDGGDRMWKNSIFMRMPDPETLAFKGVIPESTRRFISVGDPAILKIVGFADQAIEGTVSSIATSARDTTDKETKGWGDINQSGVKVYDVVVKPDRKEPWMHVGAHAQIVITAAKPITTPIVPLTYVRMIEGEPNLAIDGELQRVSGTVSGEVLVLDDHDLIGREVSLHASHSQTDSPGAEIPDISGALFTTTGELVPAASTPVVIQRIFRWQKITWLIQEDTIVTQGMVVARLDDKETLDDIAEWESRLTSHVADRETQEQTTELLYEEQAYQLAVASNRLELARIAYETGRDRIDDQALADSQLSLTRARIRQRTAERNLDRLRRLPPDRVAAVEMVAAERALERAQLQLETAGIQDAELKKGIDEYDLERLLVAYTEAERELELKIMTAETERIAADAAMHKALRREAHTTHNLRQRERMLENLTLRAPCDGAVRHNRIWSNGSLSRVQVGVVVGSRFAPLQIVDSARMEVRAEIPERHFGNVAVGKTVEVRVPSVLETSLTGTISEIEYLFEQRRPKDTERGLYSAHEALGETVFYIRVEIDTPPGTELKPGSVAVIALRENSQGRGQP